MKGRTSSGHYGDRGVSPTTGRKSGVSVEKQDAENGAVVAGARVSGLYNAEDIVSGDKTHRNSRHPAGDGNQ